MATNQNSNSEEKTKKATVKKAATGRKAAAKEPAVEKKETVRKASAAKTTTEKTTKTVRKTMAAKKDEDVKVSAVKTASKKSAAGTASKTAASKTAAAKSASTKAASSKADAKKSTAVKTPVAEKKAAGEKTEKKTVTRRTAVAKSPAVKVSEKKVAADADSALPKVKESFAPLSPTGVMVKETVKPAAVSDADVKEPVSENLHENGEPQSLAAAATVAEAKADMANPSVSETKNDDYQALDHMMQSSGLRKKSESSYSQYKDRKNGKKYLLLLLLLLGLFGAGIGIGVKFFSGLSVEKGYTNPEDVIAHCEKLIEKGQFSEALGLLAGLEINGNDEASVMLRKRINSLMKSGFEKAFEQGKEDEILKLAEALAEKGHYSEALKILAAGSGINGDTQRHVQLREKINELEKKTVGKAVESGHAQEVIDTAKKLISDGEYVPALEILSLLDIKGNDTEARMMRNQIYGLKKEAVEKAFAEGKGSDVLDAAQRMADRGDSVEALELLSFANVIGDGEENDMLRNRLAELKKKALDKAVADGRKDEIIARAKQMISDGDYSAALGFLSSVNPDGDDQESRALRNSIKSLKKDTVERALAEGRIDEVFGIVDNLNGNKQYGNALELLNMINVIGNSPEAEALRERINSKKKETVGKAVSDGMVDDILNAAKLMIDDGDYSGALELLGAVNVDKNNPDAKRILKEVDSLKKKAIKKAIEDGRGDDILDTVSKLIRNGDFDNANEILDQVMAASNNQDSKELFKKADRLKKQSDVLSKTGNMSDEEKAKLAEKLIKEGRYDEALTLLNSIDVSGNDEKSKKLSEKISNLKKDAVAKAKKNGVDLGVLGYDENGNPVLSKEEVARRQQQEKMAKEAAEKKAEEEKVAAQIKKELEEKLRKEQAAIKAAEEKRRAAEEKKAKLEAEKRAAEEKRIQEENAKKLAAQMKALEEAAAKKAADEKRLQEEALKRAEEEKKAKEEASKLASDKLKKDIDNSISEGKRLLALGDVDGAMREFSKVESMLPADDDQYAGEKLAEIAKALYDASEKAEGSEKKRLEKLSAEKAKAAISRSSQDPDAMFIASIDALNRRDFVEAEKLLNSAIAKNPANFMYYYQLGRVLAMQKNKDKYESALNAFKKCNTLNEKFAPSYYNSGYVCEQLNRKSEALGFYQKATEVNPKHENAYIGQGHVLMEMKKYDQAMASLQKAQAINPNRSQIYQELGSCCVEKNDYSNAEIYFKDALKCPDSNNDKNALTYYNLSSVLYEQGKKSEAFDYASKAYGLKEKVDVSARANIVYNYALQVQDKGKEDDAVSLYNEVLALDPKHVKAITNLSTLYLKKGKAPDAVVILNNAYSVEPENFEVNNNLGNAYRQISDYVKSVVHFKKALAVRPKDLTVLQNLARSYASAKDYKNARAAYEDLKSKQPENLDHWIEVSRVCIFQGDFTSAEKYLVYLKDEHPSFHTAEVDEMLAQIGR